MRKCSNVVLLSGGIDSALCGALAQRDKIEFTALSVHYGQNSLELEAAKMIADYYQWPLTTVSVTPFPRSLDPAGNNLIPGRNAMFLSLACAMIGEPHGTIWIGANADDYETYPDCRLEFFTAYEAMTAQQKWPVTIKRPLINLTKREIVIEARRRGLPLELTVSCYMERHCGLCSACLKLDAALAPQLSAGNEPDRL